MDKSNLKDLNEAINVVNQSADIHKRLADNGKNTRYNRTLSNCFKFAEKCILLQKPQKPVVKEKVLNENIIYTFKCPNCLVTLIDDYRRHCNNCGQKIDWKDKIKNLFVKGEK